MVQLEAQLHLLGRCFGNVGALTQGEGDLERLKYRCVCACVCLCAPVCVCLWLCLWVYFPACGKQALW
jgi:hypothetical protein